jgi:hypothetical protein
MQLCQSTVVASAIFGNYNFGFQSSLQIAFTLAYKYYVHLLTNFSGNYDVMQQPKNISKFSKDTVCFFMFLDELIELVGRKQFNCKCWRFCSYTTAYLTDSIPTLFYYF